MKPIKQNPISAAKKYDLINTKNGSIVLKNVTQIEAVRHIARNPGHYEFKVVAK